MNRADFTTQPNGFPLESDATLGFMQTAYTNAINALGGLGGSGNVILTGCADLGATVSNGWIYLNGEVLFFKGGTKAATFVINETVTQKANDSGQLIDRYFVRQAQFGVGATQYNFADLVRIENLQGLLARLGDVVALENEVIVTGCEVTDNGATVSITAGRVFINGKFLITPSYSGAYPVYLNENGAYTTSQPGANYITFDPKTSQYYKDVLWRNSYRSGQVIELTTLSSDWDESTGLGKYEFKGFALCDGRNSTQDRRGRFVVGRDERTSDPSNGYWDAVYNNAGGTGGEKSHTLTIDEMPSHNHTENTPAGGVVDPGEYGLIRKSINGEGNTVAGIDGSGSGTEPDLESSPRDIPYQGGGQAHENRPPFIVTVFAQKL